MPALIVMAGDERYAIPEAGVVELIRLEGDAVREGIQLFQDAPVYRRRGQLLPLVRLDAELGLETEQPLALTMTHQEAVNIVVLQADGHNFGLVVDDISDIQEIVVKPLRNQLNESSLFAGATIMGDGRAILILDVQGFAVACAGGLRYPRRRREFGRRAGIVNASDAQAPLALRRRGRRAHGGADVSGAAPRGVRPFIDRTR